MSIRLGLGDKKEGKVPSSIPCKRRLPIKKRKTGYRIHCNTKIQSNDTNIHVLFTSNYYKWVSCPCLIFMKLPLLLPCQILFNIFQLHVFCASGLHILPFDVGLFFPKILLSLENLICKFCPLLVLILVKYF